MASNITSGVLPVLNSIYGGHIVRRLSLSHLRHLLYLVTPNETTFESVNQVPDFYNESSSWFIASILLEMVLLEVRRYKRGEKPGERGWSAADNITNVNAGIFSLLSRQLRPMVFVSTFTYVHEHYRLADLPWDSPFTWLIGFLGCDFTYYLWHRASHEVSFLWAFHQMHHSSEYYNLSTALRQSYLQDLATLLFDPFLALFAPPQVVLTHKALTLINQHWIHTEFIPHLGPLEWVLNTPSAHRVHHGRNAYCIDKNYAGTFIIWDRLLGTYAEERADEPIAYGLVPLPQVQKCFKELF